jgi:hypothetical protein
MSLSAGNILAHGCDEREAATMLGSMLFARCVSGMRYAGIDVILEQCKSAHVALMRTHNFHHGAALLAAVPRKRSPAYRSKACDVSRSFNSRTSRP